MTKRYKLPEALGGGEVEAAESWLGGPGGRPEYNLGDGITIIAPAGQPFEAVAPPLPPEPPVGSVVLLGGEAVQRFDDNDLADDPAAHWASVGCADRWTWERLVEINDGAPVLLVPAPEPVALPWREGADGERPWSVSVEAAGPSVLVSASISQRGAGVYLFADTAREMARALWTAADTAKAQQ